MRQGLFLFSPQAVSSSRWSSDSGPIIDHGLSEPGMVFFRSVRWGFPALNGFTGFRSMRAVGMDLEVHQSGDDRLPLKNQEFSVRRS